MEHAAEQEIQAWGRDNKQSETRAKCMAAPREPGFLLDKSREASWKRCPVNLEERVKIFGPEEMGHLQEASPLSSQPPCPHPTSTLEAVSPGRSQGGSGSWSRAGMGRCAGFCQ